MSSNNPLEALLVDETQGADLELLAEVLKPFVVIDKNKKKAEFLSSFYELDNQDRILVVLATSKAKAELFRERDRLSQKEIIDLDVMPPGSVKGTLKKLYDDREIKADNGQYFLANYQLSKLSTRMRKNHEKRSRKEN